MDDDFGDLLGLEKGEELVVKKDGEVIEVKEEKKEEPKPAPQQNSVKERLPDSCREASRQA